MGFWNKLGKIALQAAPYVAAPFTGGASLYAVPATQKLGQKWSEHDANENMKKGLAPSNFDNILNKTSGYVGMASSMGAPGISGGKNAPPTTFGKGSGDGGWQGKLGGLLGGGGRDYRYGMDESGAMGGGGGGWQEMLGGALDRFGSGGGGRGQFGTPPYAPEGGGYQPGRTSLYQGTGGAMDRGGQGLSRFHQQMRRQLGPVMGNPDQNNPNLADSIGAGRMEAIRNQPWRQGYDINTANEDDSVTTSRMPPFYPSGGRRRQAYN